MRVGVVSLVRRSPWLPLSLLGARVALGAAGARVSIVSGSAVGAEVLPAGSVAVTARLFNPSGRGLAGVALQVPSGCTMAVAMGWPSAPSTGMVSPGVPLPLRVGVVSEVSRSPLLPLSLLGKSVTRELDKVRDFVDPEMLVPIEISGRWNDPSLKLGKGFVEKLLRDTLGGELIDGLQDLFGKKKDKKDGK